MSENNTNMNEPINESNGSITPEPEENVQKVEPSEQFIMTEPVAPTEPEPVIEEVKISDAPAAKKKGRLPIIVLSVLLMISFAYICLQSVFIFLFTSGKLEKDSKITTVLMPTSTKKEDDEEVNTDLVDPHFSIVDAAAISSPDKKTLSTVEIYNKVSPATVAIYITENKNGIESVSAGSGFIISEDGYIVTNEHVVESVGKDDGTNATLKVYVPGYDDPFEAGVVGKDVRSDIAVIKIECDDDLPVVVLGDSDTLQNGELAVAIGNPLGSFQGTITVGVVSGVERTLNNNGYTMSLIQTDASVNGGNSGGPLINSFGEVIGVVNAKMETAEGVGFAIPITPTKTIIESLIQHGKVVNRPYLGITVGYVAEGAYHGAKEGVYVQELPEGGPGDQAGFKVGDRIISMDGVAIQVSNDIIGVRDSHKVGEEMEVVVDRDGKEITIMLEIGDSADYE